MLHMQQRVTVEIARPRRNRNALPDGELPGNRFVDFRKFHGNPPGGRRRPRGRAPAGAISPRRHAAFACALRRARLPIRAAIGARKAAYRPGGPGRPASF